MKKNLIPINYIILKFLKLLTKKPIPLTIDGTGSPTIDRYKH